MLRMPYWRPVPKWICILKLAMSTGLTLAENFAVNDKLSIRHRFDLDPHIGIRGTGITNRVSLSYDVPPR